MTLREIRDEFGAMPKILCAALYVLTLEHGQIKCKDRALYNIGPHRRPSFSLLSALAAASPFIACARIAQWIRCRGTA